MRNPVDHLMERWARDMARRVSRRRFLGGLGALLFGAASVPLLPVARGSASRFRRARPKVKGVRAGA